MYHERSYRLLGTTSVDDAASAQRLVEIQTRWGVSVPPSVAEWYRRGDAISILRKHSNGDPPIDVSAFETITWQSRLLLPIRHENQGVCTWAIDLDGSDDPPVLVDVDTDGEQWNPFADTFSEFVYSGIWDYVRVFLQPALAQAQNPPLSSDAVAVLQRTHVQEISTHGWPGGMQYRFEASNDAILIWSTTDQADWFAAASTANALKDLLQSIWTLDDVGRAFYACSDEGQAALKQIGA